MWVYVLLLDANGNVALEAVSLGPLCTSVYMYYSDVMSWSKDMADMQLYAVVCVLNECVRETAVQCHFQESMITVSINTEITSLLKQE